MPGSSNFVGEFLILLGVFNAKIVIAIVAFTGVALASVYTLRLFIRAMHNRVGPQGAESREISVRDGLVLVPLVLAILALALYPQLPLERSEGAVKASVAPAKAALAAGPGGVAMTLAVAKAPHVDFAGAVAADRAARRRDASCCSPACCARASCARRSCPVLADRRASAPRSASAIWQCGSPKNLVSGALRARRPGAGADRSSFCAGGIAAVLLSWRALAPREAAHGEYYALMLTAAGGHVGARRPRRTS